MSFNQNVPNHHNPPYSAPKHLSKDQIIRQNPIQVYCRVRPLNHVQKQTHDSLQLQVNKLENTIVISDEVKNISKTFAFNRVFTEENTQTQIIEEICQPILQSHRHQKGSLIFSYGVTNSGKTHTILGTTQQMGILPYLIKTLPQPLSVTGIEIYNDQFYSLSNREKLQPRQNAGFIEFKEYEAEKVCEENVDMIMRRFMENRNQNDTKINEKSSRSHAIFRIQSRDIIVGVVDLAGSQRTNKITGNIQETSAINKSLLCLGRCIQALKQQATNSSVQVPYRESKLTKVLMEYFGPNFNVVMIANINQSQAMLHQNLNVLEYAAVAKDIKHNLSKSTMSHIIKNSIEKSQRNDYNEAKSVRKETKKEYGLNSSEFKGLLTSRIKSNRKNINRECDQDMKDEVKEYQGTIKHLNEQIVRILKIKKLQQCIHKLDGIQGEIQFNFQSALSRERQQDAKYMQKLKEQCMSPTQKSENVPRFINTSMNTNPFYDHNGEKARLSLRNQLKKELEKALEEERIKKMEQRGTFMGSSIKKGIHSVDINQPQLIMKSPNKDQIEKSQFKEQIEQDFNEDNKSYFMKAVKWPLEYVKSSAKKIYDFASSNLVEIVQKSSKKIQNKKQKHFTIISFDIFQSEKYVHEKQYKQVDVQTQLNDELTVLVFQDYHTQTDFQEPILEEKKNRKKNKTYSTNSQETDIDQKPNKNSKKMIEKAPDVKITPLKNRLRSKAPK